MQNVSGNFLEQLALPEVNMTLYKFETNQFGLSEESIHLLRSGFNYRTIEFSSLKSILLSKGRQVNNWLIFLIFGLTLCSFGLFTTIKVIYEYFFANNFHHFYVEQFVIGVLPLFAGVFSIYHSLKIGPVLLISTQNRTIRLPIEELKKKSQIDDLIYFLSTNRFTKQTFKIKENITKTQNSILGDLDKKSLRL